MRVGNVSQRKVGDAANVVRCSCRASLVVGAGIHKKILSGGGTLLLFKFISFTVCCFCGEPSLDLEWEFGLQAQPLPKGFNSCEHMLIASYHLSYKDIQLAVKPLNLFLCRIVTHLLDGSYISQIDIVDALCTLSIVLPQFTAEYTTELLHQGSGCFLSSRFVFLRDNRLIFYSIFYDCAGF